MFEFAHQNYNNHNQFNHFSLQSKPFSFEIKPEREERDADIFVTNIRQQISKAEFIRVFSKFGAIAGVSLKTRTDNGMEKGQLGYIWCKSPEDRDSIIANADKDTEVNRMFFVRPVIKIFKRLENRKEVVTVQKEVKLIEKVTNKPLDVYAFSKVVFKNKDETKDKLTDLLAVVEMPDDERMQTIDEYLEMTKKNLKSLEYPLRDLKVSSELVRKIHDLLSEE
jgi:RNA recognition motif-containing protein